MLSKLKIEFNTLKEKDELKNYLKDHPNAYFCSAFAILKNLERDNVNWQLNFYCPDSDEMTSFTIKDKVYVQFNEEILKQKHEKIKKLDINEIHTSINEIIKITYELKKEKDIEEATKQILVILQNDRELGPVWNITHTTASFKLFNIKVDANNGSILEAEPISLV